MIFYTRETGVRLFSLPGILFKNKRTTTCLINVRFQLTATDCQEYLKSFHITNLKKISGKNSLFLRVPTAVLLSVDKLGQDLLIRHFFSFPLPYMNALQALYLNKYNTYVLLDYYDSNLCYLTPVMTLSTARCLLNELCNKLVMSLVTTSKKKKIARYSCNKSKF